MVDPLLVIDRLVTTGVLTETQRSHIVRLATRTHQAGRLWDLLEAMGPQAMEWLKQTTRELGYAQVATLIQQLAIDPGQPDGDDVTRLRHSLARHYTRTLRKIPVYTVTDNPTLGDLRRLYTRTTLQTVHGWPPVPAGDTYDGYEQMFSQEQVGGRTLLLGAPGSGKSLLCRHLALSWADAILPHSATTPTSQDWKLSDGERDILDKIIFLLFIDLSRIRSEASLLHIMHDQLTFRNSQDYSLCIDFMQAHQENVLIILDAWDEFNPVLCPDVAILAHGQTFPDSTVLISSRIRESTALPKNVDHTVKTIGFSKAQAKRFMANIYNLLGSDKRYEAIVEFLTQKNLWELFSLPFLTTYMCLIQSSSDDVSLCETVTDLFISIISYVVNHHRIKQGIEISTPNLPLSTFQSEILALGQVALDGLLQQNTQTVFEKKMVQESLGEGSLQLGLLHMIESNNPMQQSQVGFGHKSLQEFIAAIYVVHAAEGCSMLKQHLNSLVPVYDLQLLITFICGLDGTLGRDLIELIKELTATSTATVAQCPGFSMYAWSYEGTARQELFVHDIARETMPFILDCSGEVTYVSSMDHFPSKNKSNNKEKPPVSCRPQINLKVISLEKTMALLRHNAIVFSPDREVLLYNVHADNDNVHTVESLLREIDTTETVYIRIDHSKCNTVKPIFTPLIKKIDNLQICYILHTELPPSDMQGILQHLAASLTQTLTRLYFGCTVLQGCEATLCHVVSQLLALRELILRDQALAGHEQQLCDAVSHLHQLLLLDLSDTNMSAAGGALPGCLASLPQLRWLQLYHCKLGSEQVSRVCQVVGTSCTQLLHINLAGNELHGPSLHSLTCLGKLNKVQYVTLPVCDLSASQEIRLVFSSLPASVLYLGMADCTISDDVTCITALIPTKPNLRYLRIDGDHVSERVVLDLREACQQAGVVLITTHEEWRQHYAGINALEDQIIEDIRALY